MYAYVSGWALKAIDPLGLQSYPAPAPGMSPVVPPAPPVIPPTLGERPIRPPVIAPSPRVPTRVRAPSVPEPRVPRLAPGERPIGPRMAPSGAPRWFRWVGRVAIVASVLADLFYATPVNQEELTHPWKHDSRYFRPGNYRKGVRDRVWEQAVRDSPGGVVRDPKTGQELKQREPWDMGHREGYEFEKHRESAWRRGLTREEFLDEYNDPSHYRPELPSSNRSRTEEAPSDVSRWPSGAHNAPPERAGPTPAEKTGDGK